MKGGVIPVLGLRKRTVVAHSERGGVEVDSGGVTVTKSGAQTA
jgi:hypothetical protein